MGHCMRHESEQAYQSYSNATYNSWMILSKLMTANKRDAIAAPEMRARATMRKSEEVFATVAGDRLLGRE